MQHFISDFCVTLYFQSFKQTANLIFECFWIFFLHCVPFVPFDKFEKSLQENYICQFTFLFCSVIYTGKHLFPKFHLNCGPGCIVSASLPFGNTLCSCASDIWNNWSILLFRNYLKRYLSFTLCWNILCFGISDIWLIWLIIVGIVFCPLWHTSMVL